eukprot:jgi/Chlat1/2381/Chrsp17S02648
MEGGDLPSAKSAAPSSGPTGPLHSGAPPGSAESGRGREGGTSTCQECGNQAKKDCSYHRCRTCCNSRGYTCESHIKSTWVPAAKRRERQAAAAMLSESSGGEPPAKVARTKGGGGGRRTPASQEKPVVELIARTSDVAGIALPPASQISMEALQKLLEIKVNGEGPYDFGYHAVVKVQGETFKGILYNMRLEKSGVSELTLVKETAPVTQLDLRVPAPALGLHHHHHHHQQHKHPSVSGSNSPTLVSELRSPDDHIRSHTTDLRRMQSIPGMSASRLQWQNINATTSTTLQLTDCMQPGLTDIALAAPAAMLRQHDPGMHSQHTDLRMHALQMLRSANSLATQDHAAAVAAAGVAPTQSLLSSRAGPMAGLRQNYIPTPTHFTHDHDQQHTQWHDHIQPVPDLLQYHGQHPLHHAFLNRAASVTPHQSQLQGAMSSAATTSSQLDAEAALAFHEHLAATANTSNTTAVAL